MRRTFFGVLLLTLSVIIASGPLHAACEEALVRSTLTSTVKDDLRLSTLVTEQVWNEATHNGTLNVPIYGIPAGASYRDYQARAQSASASSSYSREQLINIAWTGLDPNSVTTYAQCIQLEEARVPGLHLSVTAADPTGILLLITWNVPNIPRIGVRWTTPVVGRIILPRRL